MLRPPPRSTLFPYTTLFRSPKRRPEAIHPAERDRIGLVVELPALGQIGPALKVRGLEQGARPFAGGGRSEEHTSELQSHSDLVCRLLLEKKNISPTDSMPLG